MRPAIVVVGDILPQNGAKMFLVDNDHMIQALSAECAYYSFGDGVRVSKDTTDYLYDRQSGLPLLVDDETNAYLHDGGALATIDGSDDPLYLLDDALGSVRGVTDEAGDLDGTADYAVFGEVRASSGVSTLFRFTGEQHDTETGFTYLRARYANPSLGRFVSADTVQPNAPGTQGYNLYAYVANNPMTWVDPSGHSTAPAEVMALRPLLAIQIMFPTFIARVYTLCAETYSGWCTVVLAGTTLGIAACAMYEDCRTGAIFDADVIESLGSFGPNDFNLSWEDLKNAAENWPKVAIGAAAATFNKWKCLAVPPLLTIDPLTMAHILEHSPGALGPNNSEFNTSNPLIITGYIEVATMAGVGKWQESGNSCRLHQAFPFTIGTTNQKEGKSPTNCLRVVTHDVPLAVRTAYPVASSWCN